VIDLSTLIALLTALASATTPTGAGTVEPGTASPPGQHCRATAAAPTDPPRSDGTGRQPESTGTRALPSPLDAPDERPGTSPDGQESRSESPQQLRSDSDAATTTRTTRRARTTRNRATTANPNEATTRATGQRAASPRRPPRRNGPHRNAHDHDRRNRAPRTGKPFRTAVRTPSVRAVGPDARPGSRPAVAPASTTPAPGRAGVHRAPAHPRGHRPRPAGNQPMTGARTRRRARRTWTRQIPIRQTRTRRPIRRTMPRPRTSRSHPTWSIWATGT
jgi:hypothetical protein